MLATVILDAYKKDEVDEMVKALDMLCSPHDSYGWASAGLYSFWNYYTKEVYYIGLAVDLTERFKQHNGVLVVNENGCKRKQIESYFSENEKLGFSIFVQSPLSQPVTSKNVSGGIVFPYQGDEDIRNDPNRDNIKQIEGILLEVYKMKTDSLPKWNKVGGSVQGQKAAVIGNFDIIGSITHATNTPLISKYSLRELADNPTYERYENFVMHPARFYMLYAGFDVYQALRYVRMSDSTNTYEEMKEIGYFERELTL